MNKLVAVVGVAGLAFGGWRLVGSQRASHDETLVSDRLWIDHMPKDDRDKMQAFLTLDDEIGLFQVSSAWQGQFETFTVESDGRDARLTFPQSGKTEKVRFTASECKQGDFEYCLEISGSKHGVKRYYSREGWELSSLDAERKLVEKLARGR